MSDSIPEIEEEIIEEFGIFDNWMDKYQHIIDLARDMPMIDEKHRVDENLIKGCQSRVWLHADIENGNMQYAADSDAVITKGIIALMIRVLNDKTPDEIIQADLDFINRIGLKEHLSPTRSNGLLSMIKQMKMYALAYKSKV